MQIQANLQVNTNQTSPTQTRRHQHQSNNRLNRHVIQCILHYIHLAATLLQTRPLHHPSSSIRISGVKQKSYKGIGAITPRDSSKTTQMRKRLPQTLSLPAQTPQRLFYPPCPSNGPRTIHPALPPLRPGRSTAGQTGRIITGQKITLYLSLSAAFP